MLPRLQSFADQALRGGEQNLGGGRCVERAGHFPREYAAGVIVDDTVCACHAAIGPPWRRVIRLALKNSNASEEQDLWMSVAYPKVGGSKETRSSEWG